VAQVGGSRRGAGRLGVEQESVREREDARVGDHLPLGREHRGVRGAPGCEAFDVLGEQAVQEGDAPRAGDANQAAAGAIDQAAGADQGAVLALGVAVARDRRPPRLRRQLRPEGAVEVEELEGGVHGALFT
jgi:hypothetical protein